MHIISGITSLMQYQLSFNNNSDYYRLEQCLYCGRANPHRHGCYPREADRINKSRDSLNPISIQRYYCPKCRKTSSVLPECIPPHRWYLWDIQQMALTLCLGGKSLCAAARALTPSRQTIGRWIRRFKGQFLLHKDVLSQHFTQLGLACDLISYWHSVFKKMSLGQAMRLCHVAGVVIP
jgi:transposase-like protein